MPVPAVLRGYAREWERTQQILLTETLPDHEALLLREALVDPAEVRALIDSVFRDIPEPPRFPPHRAWHRLTEEELAYTPTTDAEAAKAKIRAQVQQILAEERAGHVTG